MFFIIFPMNLLTWKSGSLIKYLYISFFKWEGIMKLTIMGAGSTVFSKNIIGDVLCT